MIDLKFIYKCDYCSAVDEALVMEDRKACDLRLSLYIPYGWGSMNDSIVCPKHTIYIKTDDVEKAIQR